MLNYDIVSTKHIFRTNIFYCCFAMFISCSTISIIKYEIKIICALIFHSKVSFFQRELSYVISFLLPSNLYLRSTRTLKFLWMTVTWTTPYVEPLNFHAHRTIFFSQIFLFMKCNKFNYIDNNLCILCFLLELENLVCLNFILHEIYTFERG